MVPHSLRILRLAIAVGAPLAGCFAAPRAACADSAPVIAIPGHLGVPVIINGIDATGAEVYGDWGLSRPGHGALMIGGTPTPQERGRIHYFPTSLPDHGAGQTKSAPAPSRPARPATSTDFHQSWSGGSNSTPAPAHPPARPAASTDFHQSWSAGSSPVVMPDQPPPVLLAPPPAPYGARVPTETVRP